LRNQVNTLRTEATNATKPMTDLDYESFGINPSDLPGNPLSLESNIEDVGAAPPKFDEPRAVPAPETPASSPVAQKEAPKLESSATGTSG
jgi:hypothetical protein